MNYVEGQTWEALTVGQSICFQANGKYNTSYLAEIAEILPKKHSQSFNNIKVKLIENLTNKGLLKKGEIVEITKQQSALTHESGQWCRFDPLGRIEIPTRVTDGREHHPSYGQIAIHKYTGGKVSYYGSSIEHQGGISLKISKGHVSRSYGSDHYSADDTVIEVNMSYNQWVEAITAAMNTEGVPCTITQIGYDRVAPAPHFDQRGRFDNRFEAEMKKISDNLQKTVEDTKTILSLGKAPTKAQKEMVLNQLGTLKQELSSNIPYLASCFEEKMDDAVLEAKQEMDGFFDTMIQKYGKEAIAQLGMESPKLIED